MVQELGVDQFAAQDFQGFTAVLACDDGEVQVSGRLDQVLRFLLFLALVFSFFGACPTGRNERVERFGCCQIGVGIEAVDIGKCGGALAEAVLGSGCVACGGDGTLGELVTQR